MKDTHEKKAVMEQMINMTKYFITKFKKIHVSIKQEMIDMRGQEKLGKAESLKEMKHEFIEIRKQMEKKDAPALPPVEKILLSFLLCATLCLLCQSVQSLSRVQLFATPWTAVHQASLSTTISWSLLKSCPPCR